MFQKPLILAIYAEGGTNNGDYLIQFKKGAFYGLNSVQPVAMKYDSPWVSASALNLNIMAHAVMLMAAPYCILRMKEYPIFKPNDYFFKHY